MPVEQIRLVVFLPVRAWVNAIGFVEMIAGWLTGERRAVRPVEDRNAIDSDLQIAKEIKEAILHSDGEWWHKRDQMAEKRLPVALRIWQWQWFLGVLGNPRDAERVDVRRGILEIRLGILEALDEALGTDQANLELAATPEPERPTAKWHGLSFRIVDTTSDNSPSASIRSWVAVRSITFECPMQPKVDGREPWDIESECGAWIAIILDLSPSVWVCPACGGVMVLAEAGDHTRIEGGDTGLQLPDGLTLSCHSTARMAKGDRKNIAGHFGFFCGGRMFMAHRYDREQRRRLSHEIGPGNSFVSADLIPLDQLHTQPEPFRPR